MSKDYYKVLGVDKKATQDEIKRAYRKLAMKFHPDRNKDDKAAEDRFKEIGEAYAVLSDPAKRRQFESFGSAGFKQRYSQEDIYRGSDINDVLRDLGLGADFFSRIFGNRGGGFKTYTTGGGRPGGGPWDYGQPYGAGGAGLAKGSDLIYELPISLEDVFNGADKVISYRRAGKAEKVSVKIPPGIGAGKKLRLAGKGEPGPTGALPGDLLIRVRVTDHNRYTREDDDLITRAEISYSQAALGSTVEVPTLDGKSIVVKVPRGAQNGARLRVKGQGLPRFKAAGRGHLYVNISIPVPKRLTRRQRDLLEELGREGL